MFRKWSSSYNMKNLTVISMWTRMHNDKIHKQKLKEIQKRPKESTSPETMKYLEHLQRGSIQQEKERTTQLIQSNLKMFKRLNELVDGRLSKTVKARISSLTERPAKSLSKSFRQKESTRIQHENEAMAKRLNERPSCVNTKQMERDYKKKAQYAKQISRAVLYEKLKKIEQREFRKANPSRASRRINSSSVPSGVPEEVETIDEIQEATYQESS